MIKYSSIALFSMLTALGCASAGPVGAPLTSVAPSVASTPAAAAAIDDAVELDVAPRVEAAASGITFAHVIHDGGVRVLLDASPDASWAAPGAPKLLSKGSPVVTRRDVDRSKLPSALASAVGRKVELMRAGERVCEATITGLSLIGRVEPYFGARADWDGGGDAGKKPLSADEIADEAWKLSDPGGHALAAELGNVKGEGCGVATWARDANAPIPRVAKARPADRELSKRAVLALRKLDAYSEIQAAFEASEASNKAAPWELSGETELTVSEMSFGRDDAAWVWVSARTRESCGAFYGELSALFEVREGSFGPELSVRYEERSAPGSEPEAAINGGDGERVDVLFTGALLHQVSSRYQLDAALVPFLDCPC